MKIKVIRFTTNNRPFVELSSVLDNKNFNMTFSYNYRINSWFFSIADDNGDIANGIRVNNGVPLLKAFNDERLPENDLFFIPMDLSEPLDFFNLGTKYVLAYGSIEEDIEDEQ